MNEATHDVPSDGVLTLADLIAAAQRVNVDPMNITLVLSLPEIETGLTQLMTAKMELTREKKTLFGVFNLELRGEVADRTWIAPVHNVEPEWKKVGEDPIFMYDVRVYRTKARAMSSTRMSLSQVEAAEGVRQLLKFGFTEIEVTRKVYTGKTNITAGEIISIDTLLSLPVPLTQRTVTEVLASGIGNPEAIKRVDIL